MLTGACISRAGFNRTTAYATATWVLASEFPDIDVAYYLRGSVEAFAHHRGWTHTFMAAPVNAVVVVGGLYLWWRWRRSRDPETRHAASLREDPRGRSFAGGGRKMQILRLRLPRLAPLGMTFVGG
jgi:inner membrane protein